MKKLEWIEITGIFNEENYEKMIPEGYRLPTEQEMLEKVKSTRFGEYKSFVCFTPNGWSSWFSCVDTNGKVISWHREIEIGLQEKIAPSSFNLIVVKH